MLRLNRRAKKSLKQKSGMVKCEKKSGQNTLDSHFCEENISSDFNFSKQKNKSCSYNQQLSEVEDKNFKKGKPYTEQQIEHLKALYFKHGPNWTEIAKPFKGRKINDIKNYFGNSLRKLCKRLENNGQKLQKDQKIFFKSLLEIANQMEGIISSLNLTINYNSILMKFKFLIITLCFQKEEDNADHFEQLITWSRFLGFKLKSFGVFKAKYKRKWRLTVDTFVNILNFDPVVMETREKVIEISKQMEKNNSFTHLDDSWLPTTEDARLNQNEIKLIQVSEDMITSKEGDCLKWINPESFPQVYI